MNSLTDPRPLENSHVFTPKPPESRDDFRCLRCNKPRALHERDGFTPRAGDESIPKDQLRSFVRPGDGEP